MKTIVWVRTPASGTAADNRCEVITADMDRIIVVNCGTQHPLSIKREDIIGFEVSPNLSIFLNGSSTASRRS